MAPIDREAWVTVAAVVGSYTVIAGVFLLVGDKISRRRPIPGRTGFSVTIHVLGLLGFLVGGALAWMAYASDHPMKERHLLLPIILPALVYGYVIVISIQGGVIRFIRNKLIALISRLRR
jgi:ABC-type Fe3+ transport system permease subunit